MDGRLLHLGAVGLSNALAVLADVETRSYWDHITGEAFAGPLAGRQLDAWPISLTTVAAALALRPVPPLVRSPHRSPRKWLAERLYRRRLFGRQWLPRLFRLTMSGPADPRLPELAQGLGVTVGERARFYPLAAIPAGGIEENWNDRWLRLRLGPVDGVPYAEWAGSGERPMQLLTRWYGFAFTYPGCEVYGRMKDEG